MILDVLPMHVVPIKSDDKKKCYWFWCRQKVAEIEPIKIPEDTYWAEAYNHIYLISWSSAIIFFIIISWISTLIKYLIIKHKDKNTTYKSVLKNSALIYIITWILSLVVLRMVYRVIESMNIGIWANVLW